jgi:hypothetical protein
MLCASCGLALAAMMVATVDGRNTNTNTLQRIIDAKVVSDAEEYPFLAAFFFLSFQYVMFLSVRRRGC